MHTLFGTDGIRGRIGTGWFVAEQLSKLGNAIGQWAVQRYGSHPRILLLHDTRESCLWIKKILIDELVNHQSFVSDALILPTPAAWHIMQHTSSFDCALIISASHNPYHDNGIKIIDRTIGKITAHDEDIIATLCTSAVTTAHTKGNMFVLNDAEDTYVSAIMQYFPNHFLQDITIVLDAAQGAAYRVAEKIFSSLHARVIIINNTPNGQNINHQCGSTNPQHLQHVVISTNADIGFAFDGDGDRVIAVNRHGEIKDGDDLLALLIHHPTYCTTPSVVGTIMSNKGFEQYLETHYKALHRTSVGDKYVTEKLVQEGLILGGEPSGHIILRDLISTGDGILVALRVIEVIMYTNNWDMHTFTKFPQIIINVPCEQKRNLHESPFQDIISKAREELSCGRLVVRFSGTENYVRIMVEALTQEQASLVCNMLASSLAKELNS